MTDVNGIYYVIFVFKMNFELLINNEKTFVNSANSIKNSGGSDNLYLMSILGFYKRTAELEFHKPDVLTL